MSDLHSLGIPFWFLVMSLFFAAHFAAGALSARAYGAPVRGEHSTNADCTAGSAHSDPVLDLSGAGA